MYKISSYWYRFKKVKQVIHNVFIDGKNHKLRLNLKYMWMSSKIFIGICKKKYVSNKEFLIDQNMKEQISLPKVKYLCICHIWLSFNSSYALSICTDTHVYILKHLWYKRKKKKTKWNIYECQTGNTEVIIDIKEQIWLLNKNICDCHSVLQRRYHCE